VVSALQQAYEDSPDYVAANTALTDAQSAYEAQVSAVLADLAGRSDYQAVIKAKQAAQDAVQRARDSGATDDPDMLAALAARMLVQASAQRQLESEAFDASLSLQAAKYRVASARQAMDSLKQAMEDAIRTDPKYADATRAFDSARSEVGAADNALAAAR